MKAIFDEHATEDEFITEEGFVRAVIAADLRKAENHGKAVEARYQNEDVGSTMGAKAERHWLKSDRYSRRKWAHSMFQSVTARKAKDMTATWRGRDDAEMDKISLCDFMCLNFPHLPRSAVRRACDHYKRPPPPPPKETTLRDVGGAKEEIRDMFDGLDKDKDGLVRTKSLANLCNRLGITHDDLEQWMTELPPVLHRVKGRLGGGGQSDLSRKKSKLDLMDFERLMEPVFVEERTPAAGLPVGNELEDIKRSMEWHRELIINHYKCN